MTYFAILLIVHNFSISAPSYELSNSSIIFNIYYSPVCAPRFDLFGQIVVPYLAMKR
jgi:hypothetical protein